MAGSGADEKAQMHEAEHSSFANSLSSAKTLFSRGHDALVNRAHDTFAHGFNIVDNLTSYLGADNPFAHKVDKPEQLVWLFDSAAYRATVPWGLPMSSSVQTEESVKDTTRDAQPDATKDIPEDALKNVSKDATTATVAEATGAAAEADSDKKESSTTATSMTESSTPTHETWCTNLVAAFFARRSGRDVAEFVSELCKQLGIAEDSEESERITRRVTPIFNTILPAHTADVRVGVEGSGETAVMTLAASNRSGISSTQLVPLSADHSPGDAVPVTVQGPATSMNATIRFAAPEGWAVISDIDDTIKKTLTDQARGILQTTFVEEPEHIEGMPELYAQISEKLATAEIVPGINDSSTTKYPPPFWYLSASPYNLFPFLHHFVENHKFPPGSMYLKEASWMNITGFLASLTQDTQAYKVARMDSIHASFPRRKFICIGDSTQSDPEAYAEIYAKYPGWIKAIFIRRVANVKEIGDGVVPGQTNEDRIKDERFETAFKDVPKDVWKVFDKPDEVAGRFDELLTKHSVT